MGDLAVDVGVLFNQVMHWNKVQGEMHKAADSGAAATCALDSSKGWLADDFISKYHDFAEKFFKATAQGETDAQTIGNTLDSIVKTYTETEHLNMDEILKTIPK